MLYGIRKIEYCNAANLAFSDIFSTFVPTCTPTNEFVELCFVQGKATLKIESSVENKQPLYNAELQFDTLNIPALERGNYAFKVTTVDGQQMLIGSPTRPRVVVTTAQNVAESAGGANGYTTKCSFKAIYTPKTIPNTDEPASDTREFDICCGEIAQPQKEDKRYFEVCCGAIAQPQKEDKRYFEVCCGAIQGVLPQPPLTIKITYEVDGEDTPVFGQDEIKSGRYWNNGGMAASSLFFNDTTVIEKGNGQIIIEMPNDWLDTDSANYLLTYALKAKGKYTITNVTFGEMPDKYNAVPLDNGVAGIINDDSNKSVAELARFT